jgi:hypothetical protein
MIRIAVALALALLTARASFAHGWYPWNCCSDHDCVRVKCEDILETAEGFEYDGVRFLKLPATTPAAAARP